MTTKEKYDQLKVDTENARLEMESHKAAYDNCVLQLQAARNAATAARNAQPEAHGEASRLADRVQEVERMLRGHDENHRNAVLAHAILDRELAATRARIGCE